jgi:hypothetical protein
MAATRRGRPGELAGMGQEERGGGSAGVSAGRPFGRVSARVIAPPAGASAGDDARGRLAAVRRGREEGRSGVMVEGNGILDGLPRWRGKLVHRQNLSFPQRRTAGGELAAAAEEGARKIYLYLADMG